jgi:hypothetical protein
MRKLLILSMLVFGFGAPAALANDAPAVAAGEGKKKRGERRDDERRAKKRERILERFDADGDGRLNKAERRALREAREERRERRRDGKRERRERRGRGDR